MPCAKPRPPAKLRPWRAAALPSAILLLTLAPTAMSGQTGAAPVSPAASQPKAQQQVQPQPQSQPQPTPDSQPTPPALQRRDDVITLQAKARAVLLDVVVTDSKGRPVTGLKPSDFEVLEDNQLQTINSFEEHHEPTPAELAGLPKPAPLPPNTWSNRPDPSGRKAGEDGSVVILMDALNTPITAQAYVRDQTISYLKTMQPGTSVAIFQLDTELHLLQGFTADPAVLLHAVQGRDMPKFTPVPQRGGYAVQQIRMDVLNIAMQNLSGYLRQFPGRKSLAWFTARLPFSVYDEGLGRGALQDPETFEFDLAQLTDKLELGRVAIYPIDSRGLETDPAYHADRGGMPSRNSAAAFSTRQFYQHTDLDAVAQATGGRAFYNTNGIKSALAEIVATSHSFYTLAYSPTNKNWTGEYRKLKVVTTHPGLQLAYRPGYYAIRDTGATVPRRNPRTPAPGAMRSTAAPDRRFHDAMALGAVDPAQIIFQAGVTSTGEVKRLPAGAAPPPGWGLEPKLADKPYRDFEVHFQCDGHQLQLTPRPGDLHAGKVEFVVLVYDDQGVLASSASAAVDMTLKPETYNQILSAGFSMPVTVKVPEKGRYFLRLGVHDMAGGSGGALQLATDDVRPSLPTP